jgi:hypothetical protein
MFLNLEIECHPERSERPAFVSRRDPQLHKEAPRE